MDGWLLLFCAFVSVDEDGVPCTGIPSFAVVVLSLYLEQMCVILSLRSFFFIANGNARYQGNYARNARIPN